MAELPVTTEARVTRPAPLYVKKPPIVEAIEYRPSIAPDIKIWLGPNVQASGPTETDLSLYLQILPDGRGLQECPPGAYIVQHRDSMLEILSLPEFQSQYDPLVGQLPTSPEPVDPSKRSIRITLEVNRQGVGIMPLASPWLNWRQSSGLYQAEFSFKMQDGDSVGRYKVETLDTPHTPQVTILAIPVTFSGNGFRYTVTVNAPAGDVRPDP